MFTSTKGKPLPDHGLFGVSGTFARVALQQTAHCHNRCVFCALPEDTETPKGIMDIPSLERVLRAIPNFSGLVDLATDGESLLLNDLPERCALIKRHWPDSVISVTTTFNIDRGPEYVRALFASGLHRLRISCYGHTAEDYANIHGTDTFDALTNNIRYLKSVPNLEEKTLLLVNVEDAHTEFGIADADEKRRDFEAFAADNGIRKTTSTRLHSWQGRVPFGIQGPRKFLYPCSVVWGGWADDLHIRWDLKVVPCCYFTGHEFCYGDLSQNSLEEIFTSEIYRAFYRLHWEGALDSLPVCNVCTQYHSIASKTELMRFAVWQGNSLAGKKVYFWGAGEAYRAYKTCFGRTLPQAILLDTGPGLPEQVDGLPVTHPDTVLLHGEKLPLVIFAFPQHSGRILRTIAERYPRYALDDIFLCPADYGNREPHEKGEGV